MFCLTPLQAIVARIASQIFDITEMQEPRYISLAGRPSLFQAILILTASHPAGAVEVQEAYSLSPKLGLSAVQLHRHSDCLLPADVAEIPAVDGFGS